MDENPAGSTVAERLTWLLKNADPAGPISAQRASAMVLEATGEAVSHQTIWNIAKGNNANPSFKIMDALGRAFNVPTTFWTGRELSPEDAELLGLIRAAGINVAEMRTIAGITPGVRRAMFDLIRQTARAEAERTRSSD
jgi:transcriptional regulator with XRE-family HTH domain